MKQILPRVAVLLTLLAVIGGGGWYLDSRRARELGNLSGFFESRPTSVAGRTGGRISAVLVDEGSTVVLGQPLVRIEAGPDAQLARAKAEAVAQAVETLREALNGPRPEEIVKQQAVVAELKSNLARLVLGRLPEEVAGAAAHWRAATAVYQKVARGARPQEKAAAFAAEQAAYSALLAAKRGPTTEDRAAAHARLDGAVVQENLARAEWDRYQQLFAQGAISKQQADQEAAALASARAHTDDLREAARKVDIGTPADELMQAEQVYLQAHANRLLISAGSRPEDIQAAAADANQALEALKLVKRGARREDIRAAQARVAQAQAALDELLAGTRPEEIARHRAAVAGARGEQFAAQAALAERTVRSPIAGIVERIPVAAGDLVAAGTELVRMSNPREVWLRVFVPETNLASVHVGDTADLKVDGIGAAIVGRIESIDTQGEFTPANLQTPSERGKQVFGVRILPVHPDVRLKAGIFATVTRIGGWKP